jgi:oligopeptide/dipeptide ABC transporter ATP-binding protein
MALLSVRNLGVEFTVTSGRPLYAVRGISFDLDEGQILGIVGESGSGKSVTALSLLRLLPGNGRMNGSVIHAGRSVEGMTHREMKDYRGGRVSMIFQEPGRSFDPLCSVESTFHETLRAHYGSITMTETRARTIQLLNEVGIPDPARRLTNYPHQFSGGQLQRIMIALALASDPEILIADEPTTALDVTIQAEIIRLLGSLRIHRKLAILFITHDIHLVSSFADRILVMYGGLVMEEGPSEEITRRPRHPYTLGLMDAVPRFGNHYTGNRLKAIPGTVPDPKKPEPGCPFSPRCSLARPECLKGIPPIIEEETKYRCIVPGVKG